MRTTQKEIRRSEAIDVTTLSNDELYKIKKDENGFNQIAYSCGIYGVNGMLLQGYNSKKLYKVCSRTSAIFILY